MEHEYNLVTRVRCLLSGDSDVQSESCEVRARQEAEQAHRGRASISVEGSITPRLLFGATGGLALGAPSRTLALLGCGFALGAPSRALFLLDRQAFERELQRGIRRDAPSREATCTVALFPWDGELALLANGHAEAALVPAGDNLPDTILAREGLLATVED